MNTQIIETPSRAELLSALQSLVVEFDCYSDALSPVGHTHDDFNGHRKAAYTLLWRDKRATPAAEPTEAPIVALTPVVAVRKASKPRKPAQAAAAVAKGSPYCESSTRDTSEPTEKAMRAAYTKTAPYHDVQFALAHGQMSARLRSQFEMLAATVDASGKFTDTTRSEFYRYYQILKGRKRDEANAADWATGVHSVWDLEAAMRVAQAIATSAQLLRTKAAAWRDARQADSDRSIVSLAIAA